MKLKDNKIYRWIIIPVCIALCFFGRFIPGPEGLSSDAMGVISIYLGSLILWLTIGIDWPSLLCIFALAFLDNIGFNTALSKSFGNATFIFLLFTFLCTYALSKTTLIRRIALWFISTKLAKKNGNWFVALFLFAVLVLGLFISPSVLFVIILPILNEVFAIAGIEKGDKVAKVLMMGLGFTVSISSGMTPIAHVFPVLAMNAAGVSVSPLAYMGMAIPVGLITFVLMLLVFRFVIRPDVSKLTNVDTSTLSVSSQSVSEDASVDRISKKEITILSIFVLVILLWIVPSFFKDGAPEFYNAINKYGTAMPPILGVLLLCIIRFDGKPIITIEDAFKNGVPWTALMMCAATLVLGAALTDNAIGIKAFLQTNLSSSLSSLPAIALLIIFCVWAALQTNLSSNMVTATLVSTVAASILVATNAALSIPAVASVIGMLASFAFATPPSMPHIAIVAGSDYCDTEDVLIYGSLLMVITIVVALLVGYPLGSILM